MKMKRVLLLAAAAVMLTAAAGVEGAWAQAYPNKPIKIIVPFPPGNTVDTQSRLIGPKLTERMGQPVIVENRLGASGMLGMGVVAKSAPDGYTLAAGQGGNLCVLPHTSKNVPYDALKDFAADRAHDDQLPGDLRPQRGAVQDAPRNDRLREGQPRQDDRGHQR